MKFFWLNFHLPYSCRHSGACCKAGWPIPVEPERAVLIRKGEWLDEGGVLPRNESGACVFHDRHCTVYEHRPLSCVHFPYVCMIDPRGVHVTLSHYCPTAAALLFEHEGPIEVVEGPSPVPLLEIPEGLDARESLPPLVPAGAGSPPRVCAPAGTADARRVGRRRAVRRAADRKVIRFRCMRMTPLPRCGSSSALLTCACAKR